MQHTEAAAQRRRSADQLALPAIRLCLWIEHNRPRSERVRAKLARFQFVEARRAVHAGDRSQGCLQLLLMELQQWAPNRVPVRAISGEIPFRRGRERPARPVGIRPGRRECVGGSGRPAHRSPRSTHAPPGGDDDPGGGDPEHHHVVLLRRSSRPQIDPLAPSGVIA